MAGIEQQLLRLAGHHHHLRASACSQRIHQLSGRILAEVHSPFPGLAHHPARRILFTHSLQLHHPAHIAQRLANLLRSLLIRHLHSAQILGQRDVVRHKEHKRLRIRPAKIGVDGRKLFLLLPPSIERLHVAQNQHLKWSHQGGSLRQVERLKHRRLRQIQIM